MANSLDVPTIRATRRSRARRGGAVGAGGLLLTGTAAALLTALAGQAGASATIIVDSNADGTADTLHCTDGISGNCTLRDAAALAVDGDTITFDASVSAITVTQGQINFQAVNLTGPGSADLTVTYDSTTSAYIMFLVSGTGDATVSGLTLVGKPIKPQNQGNFALDDVSVTGSYQGYGGGLYASNNGNLTISNSHFANDTAAVSGGAVYAYNPGSVTVTNTTIENSASFAGGGGGLKLSARVTDVTIMTTSITGNTAKLGAGIESLASGTTTILDSDISTNTTSAWGGAGLMIHGTSDPADMVRIERTTVDGNTAQPGHDGGGMKISEHSLVMIDSTVSNNHSGNTGGGIAIDRGNSATISNTTITGNDSRVGGGLYASHMPVTLNQSTITNNAATGGGVGSVGGGVWLYFNSMDISGTIISGNTSDVAGREDVSTLYVGAINSDHSIVGNYGPVPNFAPTYVTDLGGTIFSTTPGLLALANNGGPTKTMALASGSPAIDAGPNPVATFTGNGFDQRGTPYVRVSNGRADIGAFEVQAGPPPSSSTTSSSTSSTTSSSTVPSSSTSSSSTVPSSSTSSSSTVPSSSTTTAPSTTTTLGVLPTSPSSDEEPMIPTFTG